MRDEIHQASKQCFKAYEKLIGLQAQIASLNWFLIKNRVNLGSRRLMTGRKHSHIKVE